MWIVFLICIIILLLITRQLFKYHWESRQNISRPDLKTGDLVLFAADYSRYTPNLVGIEHTHCAMVYRDGEQLKIIELTSSGDWPECNSKPIIHDFDRRVNEYHGYVSIKRIKRKLDNHKVLETAKRYADVNFDIHYTQHFIEQAFMNKRTERKKWCCSEYIYMILCDLGVYDYNKLDFHDSFRRLSHDEVNFTKNYTLI